MLVENFMYAALVYATFSLAISYAIPPLVLAIPSLV